VTDIPRLSVGLPVYNGGRYLAETLDSLLGQSFTDFELIISDNASTDGTEEICRRYAAKDPRIQYVRQPRNIGANPNHNFVLREARGEYFKWAAHDDLYGRELLDRCVAALDEHPDVVLSHVDKAIIDEAGTVVQKFDYTLATDSSDVRERFRSLVVADGADDEYGVIRTHVLRSIRPKDSYHHASRPFMVEIAFRGRFHQIRELLYFRRDHPDRGDRNPTIPALCTNLDPRRAGQGTARLIAEYAYRYFEAVALAPISSAEKWGCYRILFPYLMRSGFHRVISRNGDPLFVRSRATTPTDLPASDMTTRGDTTS
jgi:glycosyltransferase involved in cell wall biosynthesis